MSSGFPAALGCSPCVQRGRDQLLGRLCFPLALAHAGQGSGSAAVNIWTGRAAPAWRGCGETGLEKWHYLDLFVLEENPSQPFPCLWLWTSARRGLGTCPTPSAGLSWVCLTAEEHPGDQGGQKDTTSGSAQQHRGFQGSFTAGVCPGSGLGEPWQTDSLLRHLSCACHPLPEQGYHSQLCVSLGPREPLVAGTEVQSTDLWKVLSHLC